MVEFLKEALASGPFLPLGHCYLWISELVWLHVVSDALITLAYYVMPIILVYFVRKRRDLPVHWMFLMFGAFIVACGTTHLMSVWNLWYPSYWASGAVKSATAGISLISAVLLLRLVPRALAIPSPAQLETLNRNLAEQIHEREHVEAALLEARDELEHRVQERTAALAAANEALQVEIAERRRVEAYFRLLVEGVQDYAILGLDVDGRVVSWNTGAERIKGYRPEEIMGQSVACFYAEEDVADGKPDWNLRLAAVEGRCEDEGWRVRKDGSRFWANVVVTALRDETGGLIGFADVTRDLTEQRQAQDMLQQSQHMLQLVLENIPQQVFWKARNSTYLGCNKVFADAIGLRPEDIIGKTDDELAGVRAEEADQRRLVDRRVMEQGQPEYHSLEQIHRPNGRIAWLETNRIPLHDKAGKVIGVLGTYDDITERRQAEEAVGKAVVDTMQHAAQLRGLSEAALAINSALSIDEVLQLTTEQARIIIGAHQSVVSLTVPQSEAQAISASSLSDKYAGWRADDVQPDASGLSALVCADNRPMRLTQRELEAHPAWRGVGQEQNRQPPLWGWLAAPLSGRDGRNMGLLQLSDKYEEDFTENDESIIVQLAQMASVALENTRLFREVQQAEEQLKRQLQFTKSITDSLGEGVYAVDRRECLTFVNPAAQEMLGWTAAELLGKTSHDIMGLRRADGAVSSMDDCELRSVVTGDVRLRRGEVSFTRKDGTILPVACTVSSIQIDGEFVGAVVAFHDISERKRAEEMQARLAAIVESSDEAIVSSTLEGVILSWNKGAERLFDYTSEEIIGRSWALLIPPHLLHQRPVTRERLQRGERVHHDETERVRKDGTLVDVSVVVSPIHDAAGNILGASVIARDITERKKAEEALRSAHILMEKIFTSLDQAIILVDAPSRTIITCNPAIEQIFGYSKEEVLGCNTEFLYPNRELYEAARRELFDALDRRDVHHAERQMRRKDGSLFFAETSASALTDDAGRRTQVLSVWRDITERRRAEEEIRRLNAELEQRVIERTAQLEATNHELETFSYSVSHDLRAPLRGIDGFSQALLEDYAERLDAGGKDYLQRIRGASQRMGELIDALLALSRVTRTELQRETIDLSGMAWTIAEDLQRQEPHRRVEWMIADGLMANGDARLLRVALENLLGNAWKFTAKTPMARIEFGKLSQDEGPEAYFVSDNGVGFDMAYADKLFGAFQRLHRVSEFQGTGIGLATVQRIIHRHGGRVWARGDVDEGATFSFTLS